jgi:hypothetical protein
MPRAIAPQRSPSCAPRTHHAEEIDQLAGGIAHNFNNLMAIVLGYANRAFGRSETDGVREDLEQIVLAADRATAITRQLLEFAGLAGSERSAVDPIQAIRDLEPKLRDLMGPNVAIDLQLEPQGPALLVDGGEFDRIVMSLALNARDAMADGGTLTFVSANRTIDSQGSADGSLAPGDYVEVSVSDTGTGIPAHALDRLFRAVLHDKGNEPRRTGTGDSPQCCRRSRGINRHSHGGRLGHDSPHHAPAAGIHRRRVRPARAGRRAAREAPQRRAASTRTRRSV